MTRPTTKKRSASLEIKEAFSGILSGIFYNGQKILDNVNAGNNAKLFGDVKLYQGRIVDSNFFSQTPLLVNKMSLDDVHDN